MIKTDYHMHTCYSFDSNEKMEDIVKQSIEIGLTEIVFTDHLETIEPGTGIDRIIDYDEYIREIEDLRHRYGKDINIMLGAEINLELQICSFTIFIMQFKSYLDGKTRTCAVFIYRRIYITN